MTDPLGQLRNALRSGRPPENLTSISDHAEPTPTWAVHRFLQSWSEGRVLGPDQAVLLRQVLRWSNTACLPIGAPLGLDAFNRHLGKAGLEWSAAGYLYTRSFQPHWLPDLEGCDDPPIRRALDESFPAEAYLSALHYPSWRSSAQKEATWATLNTPPGATKVVVLPTGSGKSLCFQLLPRFSSGLTVVVVPTVALAIDQQRNAAERFTNFHDVAPCFFAADDEPDTTAQKVKEKRTRLLFTSPEACVSGRLRTVLDELARDGWLHHLVVDEAHLVETWGAQFRVEFQVLATARRRWLELSCGRLRTFLFSATMTPRCRELLGEMFSERTTANELVCQRLRPEIRYYSRVFATLEDREAAVLDALWHLPRPAILYVTEKRAAEHFTSLLRVEGFSRVGCFHGDTRKTARRELLRQWRANELDLMVATSAFGVGIDKADVRAVLHACFPENLDRFYQEAGRGGRDGWSAVSLLLPTPRDREVAENISVRLMTPALIQRRWAAMFNRAECKDPFIYAVPMSARHTKLVGTRTYAENVRWNKRLLLQLERAAQLEILDLELRHPADPKNDREEWAMVKVRFNPHTTNLAGLIASQRTEESRYFREGFEKLDEFLGERKCASRVIGKLYRIPSHQIGCPGCPYCRKQGRQPLGCEPLEVCEYPAHYQCSHPEMIAECPLPSIPAERANFVDLVHRCVTQKGLRQFYCSGDQFGGVLAHFAEAFPANDPSLYRLDRLEEGTKLRLTVTSPLVFLHIGMLNQLALTRARGFPSVHLLCGVQNPFDLNGRHVSVNESARLWPSPESWLTSANENSLPCLPTTL